MMIITIMIIVVIILVMIMNMIIYEALEQGGLSNRPHGRVRAGDEGQTNR